MSPEPAIALCPSSSEAAQINFRKTIEASIQLSDLEALDRSNDLRALSAIASDGSFRAWGLTTNHAIAWNKIQPGDILLFVRNKWIFACAECKGKLESREISTAIWNLPNAKLILAVGKPQPLEIAVQRLAISLGYSTKFNVQRFQLLQKAQSKIVLQALPELSKALKHQLTR